MQFWVFGFQGLNDHSVGSMQDGSAEARTRGMSKSYALMEAL
jgi:hypothetical protein